MPAPPSAGARTALCTEALALQRWTAAWVTGDATPRYGEPVQCSSNKIFLLTNYAFTTPSAASTFTHQSKENYMSPASLLHKGFAAQSKRFTQTPVQQQQLKPKLKQQQQQSMAGKIHILQAVSAAVQCEGGCMRVERHVGWLHMKQSQLGLAS